MDYQCLMIHMEIRILVAQMVEQLGAIQIRTLGFDFPLGPRFLKWIISYINKQAQLPFASHSSFFKRRVN